MSPNTTLAPSATSVRTCEAPIPRAPPLISATFPANRSATALSYRVGATSPSPYIHVRTYDESLADSASGCRVRRSAASGLEAPVAATEHRVGRASAPPQAPRPVQLDTPSGRGPSIWLAAFK